MRVCGIVAEYHPFHNGHTWQIEEIRRQFGEEAVIVCCMSGNFVQRGEMALVSKFARAEMAVRCGADLVIELPSPYSLASAEGFAQNAVFLLENAGCTDLFFGSECGDTASISEIAEILLEHDTVFATLSQLQTGISYAAARERALYERIREKSSLIQSPNNILGVEYCKAIFQKQSSIIPHALPRRGPAHDSPEIHENFCSASSLRSFLLKDGCNETLRPLMPTAAYELLRREYDNGFAPVSFDAHPRMVMSYLRRLPLDALATLPGAAEGLENRLSRAIHKTWSPSDAAAAAKTKRYAYSRLRRMILCAFLGITAEEAALPPAYLRVLAFNDHARPLLRRLSADENHLPLLTKPAHYRALPPEACAAFQKEADRTDLYQLFAPAYQKLRPGADYRMTPFYFK